MKMKHRAPCAQAAVRMGWVAGLLCLLALGCGDDDTSSKGDAGAADASAGNAAREYRASIVRTTYGIPRITAESWADLGFGAGYAYAEDNFCILMREVVAANGQSPGSFGEDGGDVERDYV